MPLRNKASVSAKVFRSVSPLGEEMGQPNLKTHQPNAFGAAKLAAAQLLPCLLKYWKIPDSFVSCSAKRNGDSEFPPNKDSWVHANKMKKRL